jgi:hypothetical protein
VSQFPPRGYQPLAEPLVVTAAAATSEVASWMPQAPMPVRRPRTAALLLSALAFCPLVIAPTPTGDGGSTLYEEVRHYQAIAEPLVVTADATPNIHLKAQYPDYLPRPRALAPWTPWQPMFGVEYPIPVQSWLGYGPDQLRPKPTRAHLPQWGRNLDPITNPPAPDLSWAPRFADQVPARPRLLTARQRAWTANLDPITGSIAGVPTGWDPVYPARVVRPTLRVALIPFTARWPFPLFEPGRGPGGDAGVIERLHLLQYQALVGPMLVPAEPESELRAWVPRHPSVLVARHHLTALQQAYAANLDPIANPEAPYLAWRAGYPDAIARHQLHAAHVPVPGIAGTITSVSVDPGDLRWQPIAPAWLARRVGAADLRSARVDPFAPALPVNFNGWQPEFPDPDFVVRWHTPVAGQQVLALYTVPIPTVDIGLLYAAVRSADPVRLPNGLKPHLQLAWVANLDPLPAAALVPLQWDPEYPAQVWARVGVRRGESVAPAPIVEVLVQLAPWQGHYPSQIPARPHVVLAPLPDLRLDAATLGDDHTCIEFINWDVTQSGLGGWRVTQSGKDAPGVTQAGADDPETC